MKEIAKSIALGIVQNKNNVSKRKCMEKEHTTLRTLAYALLLPYLFLQLLLHHLRDLKNYVNCMCFFLFFHFLPTRPSQLEHDLHKERKT